MTATHDGKQSRNFLAAAIICGGSALWNVTPAPGASYHNSAFGVRVDIPATVGTCPRTDLWSDHGIIMFLDASSFSCAASTEQQPYISVYVEYNAMFDESPAKLLAAYCDPAFGPPKRTPAALRIGPRSSVVCREQTKEGWLEISIATQNGIWPGKHEGPEDETPFVNYLISLHTTEQRLSRDMDRLRDMLKRIHISTPDD